jgi:Derlin-2/3
LHSSAQTEHARHSETKGCGLPAMDMENILAGAGGGGGGVGQFPLEQWFYEMPVCTRWWTTATVVTSILVQCQIVTPFSLFYSFRSVFLKNQVRITRVIREATGGPRLTCSDLFFFGQYWRLVTTFLYFGPLSLDFLFHVFFLQRYSRLLEESAGRSPAHFAWLLLYATTVLLVLSPLISMPFLGSALSSSLVYIWSRRNKDTRLSFLGLLVFTAPYLPWVLMLFSLLLHNTIPKDEICGVVVWHGMYQSFKGKTGWRLIRHPPSVVFLQ